MQNMTACLHRRVDDEGHILCERIASGEREVTPATCSACPVASIDCSHLRATLRQDTRPPILIRYGNGRTQILKDDLPALALQQAACAERITPILSPCDCSGCSRRMPLRASEPAPAPGAASQRQKLAASTSSAHRVVPMRLPAGSSAPCPPREMRRERRVADKIIQLRTRLAQFPNHPIAESQNHSPTQLGTYSRPGEEKCVGWTD